MAKLLRIRDRLLLGLALAHDVLDEVRLVGDIVPSAYRNLYGFTPEKYKKQNLYATVHRMLRADLIEKVIENGEPKFRLSSIGAKKFVREFPLIRLQDKPWDKKWRILVFDIPEEIRWRRDVFRRKLKELGFGMYQQSVWISPHPFEDDIRQFLKVNDLDSFVYLFVSSEPFTGDIEDLVNKVWKIEELNESYWELVTSYQKEEGREEKKGEVADRFFSLFMTDPFLPRELLPKPWYGDEAREILKKTASEGRRVY